MRILFNAFIMIAELAAIVAVAWLGLTSPLMFAAVTMLLALGLGVSLEIARLKNEMPFYFDREPGRFTLFTRAVGSLEAFVKSALAGAAGLLTFLGTDQERLTTIAIVFGVCLFLGCQIVGWLTRRFKARPLRWGYFRLAAPLGLLFSFGLSFLPAPGLSELAKRVTFDLPARPTMEQASEFLFLLKQSFDEMVAKMFGLVMDASWAQTLSAIVSVNMLTGFVLALYAVVISDGVRRLEERV
ncbi:MAG: hypothetical protein ACKVP4_10005 [Hyphomicrobium sp.]